MFIRQEIEATSMFALWKKVWKMKKDNASLEILGRAYWTKQRCTGRVDWYMPVSYDDGGPLPECKDHLVCKNFGTQKQRKAYIKANRLTNYWLDEADTVLCGSYDAHIWKIWMSNTQ